MGLTRSAVETRAREYREHEPLYAVERDHVEMLPAAFASGEFGFRDAEWVVRWYFRRYLGDYPDDRRRAREEWFRRNDEETLRDVLADVAAEDDDAERVRRLVALDGVDVPVASAFLAFLDPDEAIVVGEREWTVLEDAGELSRPYPDPPTPDEYAAYLATCRELGERLDCDMWTLYRALWRTWKARHEDGDGE